MNRLLTYLGRFILIVAGFAAASLAASAFLHLLVLGGLDWHGDELPAVVTGSVLFSVPVVAAIIGYIVFVPAGLVILAAELAALRGWPFHVGAGTAIGLGIALLFDGTDISDAEPLAADPGFVLALVAAGMVGGWVYWLVAGRSAGEWLRGRPGAVSGPGPSGS